LPIEKMSFIYDNFENYLMQGNFLTAINDIAMHRKILTGTLMTYAEWIRGDVIKRRKSESYLREIVAILIKRYDNQLSWNVIADAISIDYPNTVANIVSYSNQSMRHLSYNNFINA